MYRKRPVSESLFNKFAGLQPGTLSRKGSGTGVSEQVFYITPPDNCFWKGTGFYYKPSQQLLLIIFLRLTIKRGSYFIIFEIHFGQISEAYLEPIRTSMAELFVKIVSG